MTVQQLINSLAVIPEAYRGCAVNVRAYCEETPIHAVGVTEDDGDERGSPRVVLYAADGCADDALKLVLFILPGVIVS